MHSPVRRACPRRQGLCSLEARGRIRQQLLEVAKLVTDGKGRAKKDKHGPYIIMHKP